MKYLLQDIRAIESVSPSTRGVFTKSDLKALLSPTHHAEYYRRLEALIKANTLTKVKRSLYVAAGFNPFALSQVIAPNSYISMSTALQFHKMIGTAPSQLIEAVTVGPRRRYRVGDLNVAHVSIRQGLMFGFQRHNGIHIATREKAYLDTLYYHLKGRKYAFDLYSEIAKELLDVDKIEQHLSHYPNPKFVRFVWGLLND